MNIGFADFSELTWTFNNRGVGGFFAKDRFLDQEDQYRVAIRKPTKSEYVISDQEFFARVLGYNLGDYFGLGNETLALFRGPFLPGVMNEETQFLISPDNLIKHSIKHNFQDFMDAFKKPGESIIEFCGRFGIRESLKKIAMLDFFLGNLERDVSSLEVRETAAGYELLFPYSFGDVSKNYCRFDGIYQLTGLSILETIKKIKEKPVVTRWTSNVKVYMFQDVEDLLSDVEQDLIIESIRKKYKKIKWCLDVKYDYFERVLREYGFFGVIQIGLRRVFKWQNIG